MTLLEKMKAKLARKKAIEAAAGARDLTAEEKTEITAILVDCKAIKAEMDQAAEFEVFETDLTAGTGRKTGPNAMPGQQPKAVDDDEMQGFATANEFFYAVKQAAGGAVDPRLAAATNVIGGNGGEEGFSLPPAMRSQIFKLFEVDEGDLLGSVASEKTNSTAVQMLKDVTTPWQAAGIQVHWDGAGTKMVPTAYNDLTCDLVKLHGVSVFLTVEEDLLEDSPRLGGRLMEMAPESLRWALNECIRYGDGVGKPLGYMKSPALITVDKDSNQSAESITAMNIANMYTRMLASSLKNSHWEVTSELLPALMLLKDEAGNLLFTPINSGLKDAPVGMLLGRPVMFNEHPEAAGTVGDIQLIDPKGYYMPKRQDAAKFAESAHLYFDLALKSFRWRFRVGGQPFLSKPVKPAKGKLTKSHFVTLATRA